VTEGMAAKGIACQEVNIQAKYQGSNTNAKGLTAPWLIPDECKHSIVGEETDKQDGKVKEIAMNVLQHQGQCLLAKVAATPFSYRTRGWVTPECLVISSAIVVAGKAKECREGEDNQSRRKGKPAGPPCWLGAKPGMWRISPEFR